MIEAQESMRKEAFTLVEVMIAMTIFAMVIAGGLLGVQKGFELVDNSRHFTRSSQILQSELELLRTMPWETLSAQTEEQLTVLFNEQIASQFGSGIYRGLVKTTMDGPDSMEVRVHVEWSARRGRIQSASYITYFSKRGVNDYYIN